MPLQVPSGVGAPILRLPVLLRDGIEHAPHELALGRLRRPGALRRRDRILSDPGRPELSRQADHLAADGRVVALGARQQLGVREVAPERVAQLPLEEIGAEPPLPARSRLDLLLEKRTEPLDRSLDDRPGVTESLRQPELVIRLPLRLGDRLLEQLADAGELSQRGLRVEQRDRPVRGGAEVLARRLEDLLHVQDARQERSTPLRERRELAGEEREQPVPGEAHIARRIPGALAEVLVVEDRGLQRVSQDPLVDPLVARQLRVVERVHAPEQLPERTQPPFAAGGCEIRPPVVMRVEADIRRPDRERREQHVERVVEESLVRGLRLGPRVARGRREQGFGFVGHSVTSGERRRVPAS